MPLSGGPERLKVKDAGSEIADENQKRNERWRFWRDVLVFELKMLVGNLRDLALMPVSVLAALIDIVSRGEREGSLFYRVLRWGAHSEQVLDVYSPIKHDLPDLQVNPSYTIDGIVARLEAVVLREYEKGGTAASVKAAMDHAVDQLHRGTGEHRERVTSTVAKLSENLRGRFGRGPGEETK